MDIDAFVAAHRGEWDRLEVLLRRAGRPRRLSGAEVDELIDIYQRVATHLSVVQSSSPDPALVGRLSALVARARGAVAGGSVPAWQDLARFFRVTFPAAAYRTWPASVATAAGSLLVAFAVGAWVATHADVQSALLPPAGVRRLVEQDFAGYYRNHPAGAFAAQVWTNNAWVAAIALCLGVLLGLPTLFILLQNALNVGISGGFLVAAGKGGLFFGLILPHGLLELTAVFLAAGTGLRLGATVVDPGPRRRVDALAAEGRAAVTIALGLVVVLLVSGAIEAFVTPSALPTAARIGVGVVVEAGFLAYVAVFGRRAVRAGETGDLPVGLRPDAVPTAG